MVHGGGVDGREGSGSGVLPTESADISRRIRSSLLRRQIRRRVYSGHIRPGQPDLHPDVGSGRSTRGAGGTAVRQIPFVRGGIGKKET